MAVGIAKILIDFFKDGSKFVLDYDVLLSEGKVHNTEVSGEISFWGCTFPHPTVNKKLRNFRFKDVQFKQLKYDGEITFVDCEFGNSGDYRIGDNNQLFNSLIIPKLTFENCSIKGRLIVDSSQVNSIQFQLSDCEGAICFKQVQIQSIDIRGGENSKLQEIVFIENSNVQRFFMRDILVQSLEFRNYVPLSVYLADGTYDKVWFNGAPDIHDFRINNTHTNQSNLTINELVFFRNKIFKGLEIGNCKVGILQFDSVYSNEANVKFNEVFFEEAFFINVDISNFYWNVVEFSKTLKITKCNFNKLNYSNVKWLKGKQLSDSYYFKRVPFLYQFRAKFGLLFTKFKEDDLLKMGYERESYKQLKSAAINNHLLIDQLDFYRLEMRLYWKEVRLKGGVSLLNRLIIFMNRWSSDFGQNWLFPIAWLFLFHWLWFSCLKDWYYFNNQLSCNLESAEYFKLLNPTHQVPEYVTTASGYFTDIIMRVSVAFFVYHIIRATRKYGKV